MRFLHHLFRHQAPARQDHWRSIRADDMPDDEERALHELAINLAMRLGRGVLVAPDPAGGVLVDGRHFDSLKEAADANLD